MANKNTKQLRKQVSRACQHKQDSVEYAVPVPNYHSYQGSKEGLLLRRHCPTAIVKGDGVNSVNKRRNSCQRVYINHVEGGATQSLTAHEPFLKHEPMIFPNHSQYAEWAYNRQQGSISA